MPFFTSRIDENLDDNEKHLSARSLSSSICCDKSVLNLSSRSCDTGMTSVRHVNSDAFIQNNNRLIGVSSEDVNRSETQSDIVPPLDIMSEENFPTRRDYTYSYRKHCEAGNTVLKPDKAFETWLSAKRKLLSDEAARRKKEEEMKQKEIEERKRLAKEKYDKWLETKSSKSSMTLQPISSSIKNNKNSETRPHSKLPPEKSQVRLEEWERAKRLKEQHSRMLKRQEEMRRRAMEEQRKEMAAQAWENWISSVDKKAKPVPLNRGMYTLRGTVSDIYVNPNEWQSIIQINNEDN